MLCNFKVYFQAVLAMQFEATHLELDVVASDIADNIKELGPGVRIRSSRILSQR